MGSHGRRLNRKGLSLDPMNGPKQYPTRRQFLKGVVMATATPSIIRARLLGGSDMPAKTYTWRRKEHSLALLSGSSIVWQVVTDPAEGKPYFHPLATPAGTMLTALRPQDHPWHRGLWWSWKFINGLNYWEEDRQTGRSEGATELIGSKLQPNDDGSAKLEFAINYHPWNSQPVLTERRTVEISVPEKGSYEMRWMSEFTAVVNTTLGRTPPPHEPNGVSYGGYAGLSMRLSPAAQSWHTSNSEGGGGVAALHGRPARWVRFSRGRGLEAVTIFDDPRNPRFPSRWYVNQEMPFFSPALLFEEPLALMAGERLLLQYRILVTDNDLPEGEPPR